MILQSVYASRDRGSHCTTSTLEELMPFWKNITHYGLDRLFVEASYKRVCCQGVKCDTWRMAVEFLIGLRSLPNQLIAEQGLCRTDRHHPVPLLVIK